MGLVESQVHGGGPEEVTSEARPLVRFLTLLVCSLPEFTNTPLARLLVHNYCGVEEG